MTILDRAISRGVTRRFSDGHLVTFRLRGPEARSSLTGRTGPTGCLRCRNLTAGCTPARDYRAAGNCVLKIMLTAGCTRLPRHFHLSSSQHEAIVHISLLDLLEHDSMLAAVLSGNSFVQSRVHLLPDRVLDYLDALFG